MIDDDDDDARCQPADQKAKCHPTRRSMFLLPSFIRGRTTAD